MISYCSFYRSLVFLIVWSKSAYPAVHFTVNYYTPLIRDMHESKIKVISPIISVCPNPLSCSVFPPRLSISPSPPPPHPLPHPPPPPTRSGLPVRIIVNNDVWRSPNPRHFPCPSCTGSGSDRLSRVLSCVASGTPSSTCPASTNPCEAPRHISKLSTAFASNSLHVLRLSSKIRDRPTCGGILN